MGKHKSIQELLENILAVSEKIIPGAVYRHFRQKGTYRVLGFTTFEEDDTVLVRYCPVEGEQTTRFVLLQAAADELGGDQADG